MARVRGPKGYPHRFPSQQRWDLDSDEPQLIDGPDVDDAPPPPPPPAAAPPPTSSPSSPPPAPAVKPLRSRKSPPAPEAGKRASSARRPVSSPRNFNPGGTGGGLLLALVLYPVGLNVIKYGAKGPGMWFRAKFLNQVPGGGDWGTTAPAVSITTPPGTPATPKPATPKPGQNTGTTAGPIYPT